MHVVFDLIVGTAAVIEYAFSLLRDRLLKHIGIIIVAQHLRAIRSFLKIFRRMLDRISHDRLTEALHRNYVFPINVIVHG
jgi:hypothetical protein